jgi:hypothetical protein
MFRKSRFLARVSHGGSLRWRSNITVDYRAYAQHIDKLSEWAAELSKARVDAITTVGDLAIRAAQGDKNHSYPCDHRRYGSDRTGELNGPAQTATQRGQHPCDRARRHRVANGAEIAAAIDMAQASGAAAHERSGVTDALR